MKKVFKWIVIVFIGLVILGIYSSRETPEDKAAKERYNKADQSQKACVKTLGEGALSYKSLSWKLDSCNVPKWKNF